MPIEAGTTIESLDALWPLSGDFVLEGDDHLRLLKTVLKAQFPGVSGLGFNIPIIATEDELNYLTGVTSNVQAQIDAITSDDNLYAPSGTIMVFFQAIPPLGWTQLTANDDSMLIVVDVGGGTAGGSDSPIGGVGNHTHTTGDHQLTEAETPAHDHKTVVGIGGGVPELSGYRTMTAGRNAGSVYSYGLGGSNSTPNSSFTDSVGGDQIHNHGDTGPVISTFSPKHINVITAVKD